jgi:hypothetical protein
MRDSHTNRFVVTFIYRFEIAIMSEDIPVQPTPGVRKLTIKLEHILSAV